MHLQLFIVAIGLAAYWIRAKIHNVGENGFGSATTADAVVEGLDLTGKVAVVTGANSGIGFETARVLAGKGASVVVAARGLDKAEEAINQIKAHYPGRELSLIPMEMDLNSLTSMKAFAHAFQAKALPLHMLILNAGVMAIPNRTTTEYAVETQMGVNHVSNYYLSHLLLDQLTASAPSRVVVVSSSAHAMADPAFLDSPNLEMPEYNQWTAYRNSKAASILFVREFHRRYHSQGITAASLNPGTIWTGLQQHMTMGPKRLLFNIITPFIFKTPSQGAATTVYAATSPELDTLNLGGKFFEDAHVSTTSYPELCENDANAFKLWEATKRLVAKSE